MKYLNEIQWFLKIRITKKRQSKRLCFCQNFYINKFIFKFRVKRIYKTFNVFLLIANLKKNSEQISVEQILVYQQRIVLINFVVVTIKNKHCLNDL